MISSDKVKTELIARKKTTNKCPSCNFNLISFDDMVKHYSIQHRKVLAHYYHWFMKQMPRPTNTEALSPEQIQEKHQLQKKEDLKIVMEKKQKLALFRKKEMLAPLKVIKKKEVLKVKYVGDSGRPRMIDTPLVERLDSIRMPVSKMIIHLKRKNSEI